MVRSCMFVVDWNDWVIIAKFMKEAAMQVVELIWQDLRYAARLITQRPAYALGIIFTLALVTGASTAIFSTLYELAFHRLPYPEPGRLVAIWESNRATGADHTTVTEGAFPILANEGR